MYTNANKKNKVRHCKKKANSRNATSSLMEDSAQTPRDCADDVTAVSSIREITLIETMTSFLEENGAADIDSKILRNLAEALTKRMDDTSPGTLQDVTMDQSYNVGHRMSFSNAYTSQGLSSPTATQGRSVREYEEQMNALRKENFNLKLRLYFVEESLPGYKQSANGAPDSKDAYVKQLIDSKVEMEILRKDIQEKQEILKEAAQAMTHMENLQKETESKSQFIIGELQEKIHYLEERNSVKSLIETGNGDTSEVSVEAIHRIRELEEAVRKAHNKIQDLQGQIRKLDQILLDRDETIREYELKVTDLVYKNSELLEVVEKREEEASVVPVEQLQQEIHSYKAQLADKICLLQDAEEKLKDRVNVHEQACRTIQRLMQNIVKQEDEIKKLKSPNQQSAATTVAGGRLDKNMNTDESGATAEMVTRSLSDTEAISDKVSNAQTQRYVRTIAEQETTIKNLEMEIKKKTANLQNLVNKELWEKNREIERLTKMVNKDNTSVQSPTSTTPNTSTNVELQQSFNDGDLAKALESNKLLQRKVDILIQRLGVERQNETTVLKLRQELRAAKNDAETADKWRRECADVCEILTKRLEELAGFLNTLLKHKDELGFLAADRRRAMRRAVDRSLDLSKSLNMTLSISGLSIADHSLAQLSNLSEILGEVENTENNNTFNSHEELQAQSAQSLETLKAENKALKKELDKRRTTETRKERRSLPLTHAQQENQSESEAWSEPDRKVSLARIGLEDHSSSLAKEMPAAQQLVTDSESESHSQSRQCSKQERSRTQERITQLEQLIAQRDERILEVQCQLVDADNRLKQEHLRVLNMTDELEQLRHRNQDLHTDLIAIGDQEKNADKSLLLQIEAKQEEIEKLNSERQHLAEQARLADQEIATLRCEMNEMQVKHEIALTLATEHEKQNLEQLKRDMNTMMQQRLAEQQQLHQESLARDWIALYSYDELKQQLLELQRQYVESMRTIDYQQETEQELKQSLVDSELAARALKKQLDESTLQASKAVLERSKAFNDKLQLEQQVQVLTQELKQLQITQKSLLQQAEKRQEQKLHQQQQQRHNSSDISQSGYTSEEVQLADGAVAALGKTHRTALIGVERHNNSSPDLGIESDAGRVSSVELSNAQHALLKTVELGAAVAKKEDVFEEKNKKENLYEASSTTTVQDMKTLGCPNCPKVEQENTDLRRKLIRTKRALEDTYEKLHVANKVKAQVEKDIKNQILKTHNVLRNVRSNMENEL